ncbi:MAG TPA: transporter [Polyangium sp.]|nr:transporter [Polyangium sp.]
MRQRVSWIFAPRGSMDAPVLGARKTFASALLGCVLLLATRDASASACCGSGHGLGQRLGPLERGAIGLSFRFSDRFGSYGHAGAFTLAPTGTLDAEGRAELGCLFAPIPRLQLGLVAPVLLNIRGARDGTDVGGGFGDLSLSARFDIVSLTTTSAWPAIALTAGVSLPTGRSAADAKDPLATDATGLGAVEVRPGVFVEKNWDNEASAVFSASIGLRTPMTGARGERIELGPRIRLVAAAGPVFSTGWSLSAGLVHEYESAPSLGGATTADADRRRTAALLFAGYDISERFTALASLEVDLPVSSLGKNEPSAVAFAIGLRRSFPRYE